MDSERTEILCRRLRGGAWSLLAAGVVTAAAIYAAASPPEDNPLERYLNSKTYRHDMEAYGGKVNVLADEFSRWFASLWEGRNLAGTIAVLSVLGALLLFLSARFLTGAAGEAEEHHP